LFDMSAGVCTETKGIAGTGPSGATGGAGRTVAVNL
jgi:hypothetical protein